MAGKFLDLERAFLQSPHWAANEIAPPAPPAIKPKQPGFAIYQIGFFHHPDASPPRARRRRKHKVGRKVS